MTWFDLQRRGMLLAHAARIAALSGLEDVARKYLAEIDGQPGRWPQPAIRAVAAEAQTALCKPDDPDAFRLLNLARQLWTSAGSDYHAGRVRLLLASALLAAGDFSSARAELRAALISAERIGSQRLANQIAETLAHLDTQRSAKDQAAIRTVTAG